MQFRIAIAVFVTTLLPTLTATAGESSWDVSGNIGFRSQMFTQDARWAGQDSQVLQASMTATAEFRWRSADRNQRASFVPVARWDSTDAERNLLDLQDAYWAFEGDSFELLIGVNTVFWGVTESLHLVDIINQTDTAGDIDGEDKLGQPMINLALQRDWGEISAFVMPYFRERTFPGVGGRLRSPIPVDTDRPQYESSDKEDHVDLALRYSHYIGDIDIGLSLFSGTSREPRLLPNEEGTSLLPYYDQIDQFGIDLQYTRDEWLWKLEGIVRDGFNDTFAAAVGGFEYTFYQVRESAADIGILFEYQYDGRAASEPVAVNDNDLFVGARLALNDTQDTSVLAGIAWDTETSETFLNIEAERRLGDNYLLELRVRAFSGAAPEDTSFSIVSDDYVEFQISRYY